MRTPDEIRRDGNHLKHEKSLYLEQHAHNPIDWYPWGSEALGLARSEHKPIFLSIGYSSCHWCHVMETEVFELDEIARFMNEHFVCIKVDREERPDLDAVYMDAVQAMTHQGGWPMSVFLTPDLRPFVGGTYFPPDRFMALAKEVDSTYRTRRDDLEAYAARLAEHLAQAPPMATDLEISHDLLVAAADAALSNFDAKWGGFQARMKFPTPPRWRFLLHYYRKTGDERIGRIVRETLDHMGAGGIHDHVGGGFHRYTTEPTWLIPHFEKMLYDNAQLASLYIEASVVLESERYAEIARGTLDFMLNDMSGDEGAFYGSYDADSGGHEGTFYIWSPEEIHEVAGAEDGPPLAMLLGVRPGGNFEGKSVLTRRAAAAAVAQVFGRREDEIQVLFERWRPALRERRASRTWPGLDRKIVASWNGLAIAALAQGYQAFRDERYRRAAERAADHLWSRHRMSEGGLYRASSDGLAREHGILDDYAFVADGLLALFEATGERSHLTRALTLLDEARSRFGNPGGAFYMVAEGVDAPLGRKIEFLDGVSPSGNAVMLDALLRVSALTGDAAARAEVERIASGYADLLRRAPLELAGWLDVALKLLGPYYEVVVAGEPDSPDALGLADAFRRLHPSHAVLTIVPAGGAEGDLAELLPPATGKRSIGGRATAYVCKFGTCKTPTSDPVVLRSQILEGWAR
jgi:uncharacterized protein YyaL (SSP411 family)